MFRRCQLYGTASRRCERNAKASFWSVDRPGQHVRNCPSEMRSQSPKHLSHGQGGKWDATGVLLDESVATKPVDLVAIFGNGRPVELEIGTGKGTFLLARAAARPELNFVGVEWAGSYCQYAASRFRRAGLANVRMLHADATHFVRNCLPDASIWRVHIYFPDPWPKRRHHRRRSIQPAFLAELRRILQPGGQVVIVTDHLDYYLHIRRVLAGAEGFLPIGFPQMTDQQDELVGTNFERKYIAQGRAFFNAALMKYR